MKFEFLIKEKIEELSPGQRKVAEYIMVHLEECSYLTLAKISREASVSETTVIRFAYALGFESFSAMQGALQKEILGNNEKENNDREEEKYYFNQVLNREIAILERSKKALNPENIDLATKKLKEADNVFSVSGRTVYPAALWFGIALGRFRENVYAVNPVGEEFFSNLIKVTNQSVIVAVSFARHSQSTCRFVRLAREKGAYIIVVTDNQLSPTALLGDTVIMTESNRDETGINTISSATAMLNILAVGVRRLDSQKAIARLKELEKLYQREMDVLFE